MCRSRPRPATLPCSSRGDTSASRFVARRGRATRPPTSSSAAEAVFSDVPSAAQCTGGLASRRARDVAGPTFRVTVSLGAEARAELECCWSTGDDALHPVFGPAAARRGWDWSAKRGTETRSALRPSPAASEMRAALPMLRESRMPSASSPAPLGGSAGRGALVEPSVGVPRRRDASTDRELDGWAFPLLVRIARKATRGPAGSAKHAAGRDAWQPDGGAGRAQSQCARGTLAAEQCRLRQRLSSADGTQDRACRQQPDSTWRPLSTRAQSTPRPSGSRPDK